MEVLILYHLVRTYTGLTNCEPTESNSPRLLLSGLCSATPKMGGGALAIREHGSYERYRRYRETTTLTNPGPDPITPSLLDRTCHVLILRYHGYWSFASKALHFIMPPTANILGGLRRVSTLPEPPRPISWTQACCTEQLV